MTGPDPDGITSVALRFLEHHPDESARLLESLAPDSAAALLSLSAPGLAADVLRRVVPSFGVACLAQLPRERAPSVIEALPLAAAAGLLRRSDEQTRLTLLADLTEPTRAALARLLAYPEDSAGGRMDPRVFTLPEDILVAEAAVRLRAHPEYAMYYLYVVDREQRLTGVLNYRDLLLANDDATLKSVMRSQVVRLRATASGQALLAEPAWRVYLALPVVDEGGVLIGVVRFESLREVEWGRRGQASRLAGMWRGVSEMLGGGRGEGSP